MVRFRLAEIGGETGFQEQRAGLAHLVAQFALDRFGLGENRLGESRFDLELGLTDERRAGQVATEVVVGLLGDRRFHEFESFLALSQSAVDLGQGGGRTAMDAHFRAGLVGPAVKLLQDRAGFAGRPELRRLLRASLDHTGLK